jgi:hypothetical protein
MRGGQPAVPFRFDASFSNAGSLASIDARNFIVIPPSIAIVRPLYESGSIAAEENEDIGGHLGPLPARSAVAITAFFVRRLRGRR